MKKLIVTFICLTLYHSLSAREWKGEWISAENCPNTPNTWLIYRKTINVADIPGKLEATIAADTKYWMWINDQEVVFEGGLKRGPSRGDTYYDVIEIAPYLKNGENTIAILLWHFGKEGFSHLNSGKAGLIFDVHQENIQIKSDATWQCSLYKAYQDTEEPYPNYRLPESNIRFDARQTIANWNKTSFKGDLPAAVPIAKAGDKPFGKLIQRPIPQWKNSGLVEYITQSKAPTGDTIICQLPYNCQLTPYLKVNAPAGKTIHIQTDNYTGGSENNLRAEYITCEGIQEYESLGWINGHQMWYVIPEEVEVLELKYRETGYDTEFSGSFRCNDEFLNELWKRSARTLYITMRDNYMDCPDRERAQWWGDEVNELGETFYSLSPSSHQLAVKGIHELMNWQRPDGVIFSPMPAGNRHEELPLQMLASIGWYGFYTQYYYSGDSSFVADIYDRMNVYLHQVWKKDNNGLILERPGDWNWGDWGENVDIGVLTNCWYYLALKAQKEFAAQLGKTEDIRNIKLMMTSIEKCFDTRYWNGTAYRSPGYKGATDDRSQAMAILSGLASKDKYPAILNILRKEYHASPYMEKYVLEALFDMGEAEFALQRMKERYSKMLSYPYSTLFEGWGVGAEGFGGGTINHAWSGGPLTLLSQKVCGIIPTSPGFTTFCVNPQPGNLKEASAVIETNYGFISVSFKKKGKKIEIQLTVPEGTEAEIPTLDGYKKYKAGEHTVLI